MFKYDWRIYQDEAGGDGADGGAGGDTGGAAGDGSNDGGSGGVTTEQLAAEIEALRNKNSELLGEVKKYKGDYRSLQTKLDDEARAKAEAEGNYQQLYESSEAERQSLQQQIQDMTAAGEKREIGTASLKIASELAEGANVELLSEFIARRLKINEGEIKVTDEAGNLTVSSLDDLKAEFSGSARFAALIKGSQASGGGAVGGSSGGSATKSMTRAEFEALDPASRMEKMRDGYKITAN